MTLLKYIITIIFVTIPSGFRSPQDFRFKFKFQFYNFFITLLELSHHLKKQFKLTKINRNNKFNNWAISGFDNQQ